jgi:F-type H+-transporting ATPase subunit b
VTAVRTRVLVAGGAVAALTLLSGAPAAHAAEKPTEVSKCVEEAVNSGQQADTCVKASNPILPSSNELFWGALSFVVLLVLLWKFAYPGIKKGMDDRAEKIRTSLDEAEQVRGEAQGILEQYQRQLADAKAEAGRIIEEARQAADRLRSDLRRQAEEEAAELRQRAQEDINAQVDRAMADLQSKVGELAIELAEKVVERNLDRDTNMALIEAYINQVGASTS